MEKYKSYRMHFCNEYTGQLNKFGGLPTHLPTAWPKDIYSGNELTFLCQLYCDGVKLAIENILCIQIYQWIDSDGQEGSDPIVVPVPMDAKENLHGEGISHPMLQEGDIRFEEVIEEVIEEHAKNSLSDEKGLHLWESKLKGWFLEDAATPGKDAVTPENFLGTIADGDGHIPFNRCSPFNWGCGYHLVFYLNHSGHLDWDFF